MRLSTTRTRAARAALAALLVTLAEAAVPPGTEASGVPSAVLSTVPKCIPLVGSSGGVVDPAGEFVVILRNLANNPIVNAPVVVDFSGCSGIILGAPGGPTFPGVTVDCVSRQVTAMTDLTGTARFRIAGAGIPGSPGPPPGCVAVRGNNVPVGFPGVRVYDLDGLNGMDATDLSIWLQAFLRPAGSNPSELDYDCSGTVNAADLSMWLTRHLAGGSTVSAAPCAP